MSPSPTISMLADRVVNLRDNHMSLKALLLACMMQRELDILELDISCQRGAALSAAQAGEERGQLGAHQRLIV